MRIFETLLAMTIASWTFFSCQKAVERPPYIEDTDELSDSTVFVVYESMAYDGNDHDHIIDKISPISLIYEGSLLDESGNLDMDKVNTQINLVNLTGACAVSTDIESWYSSASGLGGDELKERFDILFKAFRGNIPNCTVGNYGIPIQDINVLRGTDAMKGKSDEEIIERWKNDSKRRFSVGEVSDVLYPSLYALNDDWQTYDKDCKTTADFCRQQYPGKKVIAYVWPQYYDLGTASSNKFYKQFIPADILMHHLESCYKYFDGIVLWAGGSDADGIRVKWSDARVQTAYSTVKQFIINHWDNIKVDSANTASDEGQEPSEFHMWESMGFKNKPELLTQYGLEPINVVNCIDLSDKNKTELRVNVPIDARVSKLAESVSRFTLLASIECWIADRTDDNEAMRKRFEHFRDIFKASNQTTVVGFHGIGPTGLTGLAAYSDFGSEFRRKDSWLRYAVEPTRILRQYVDALCCDVTMIDDDIEYWKADCAQVFREAKINSGGKKIYGCIGTTYYANLSRENHFEDAFKPVKYETFLAGLEYIYTHADGVIIINNAPAAYLEEYSEDLSVIKAVKTFYSKHKSLIDSTMPVYVEGKSQVPDMSGISADPVNGGDGSGDDDPIDEPDDPQPGDLGSIFNNFSEGKDIVIGGQTFNKSTFNGEVIHVTKDTLFTNGSGIWFVDKGVTVKTTSASNPGFSDDLYFVCDNPGYEAILDVSGLRFVPSKENSRFVVSGMKVNIPLCLFYTRKSFSLIGFYNCSIKAGRNNSMFFDWNEGFVDNLEFVDSEMEMNSNDVSFLPGTNAFKMNSFVMKNCIFWSNSIAMKFRFFNGWNSTTTNTLKTGVKNVVMEGNTFYNIVAKWNTIPILAWESFDSISFKNNLVSFSNYNESYWNLLGAAEVSNVEKYPKAGVVSDNHVYNSDRVTIMSSSVKGQLGITYTEITKLPENPFSSVDLTSGKFVKKTEYDSYGANR